MSGENNDASTSVHNALERKKSNLAFAFFCLERDRARDMEILYAFCRLMDDIADEEGPDAQTKRKDLEFWKAEIARAYSGGEKLCPLGQEMRELARRRQIPQQYLQDIIDGVMRDTVDEPFETFEDIRKYCYGVAAAVGLASIYVFGFKNQRTKEFAEALGYALQFTNILRDVVDDMRSHGRVYIPRQELLAFGVKPEDLSEPSQNPNCKKLFKFLHFRAKHFFNKARRLMPPEDKKSLAPALIMWAIYERILDTIAEMDFNIPPKPLKISKPKKILLALGAIRDSKRPAEAKNFGKIAVLGGGISGMCAAIRMAYEGFDVSLYEAKAHMGGRACALEWRGAKLDNGTHAIMGCYENFRGFLKNFGTDTEEYFAPVSCMDFAMGDGKIFNVKFAPKDAGAFKRLLSFLPFCKLDGFATFANITLFAKLKLGLAKPNHGETALTYLTRMGVRGKTIDVFWKPFCVSALNTAIESASAGVMISTIKKSIFKGGDSALLYFPQRPIAEAFSPHTEIFLQGVGGKVFKSENVKSIRFDGKRVTGISTSKCETAEVDFIISALNVSSLKSLLSEGAFKDRLENISETDIMNVYFTSSKRIFDGDYVCLVNSPIDWIFDHTAKLGKNPDRRLYAITISANDIALKKSGVENLIKEEVKKYFGDCEILDILPANFLGATISADIESEAARPTDAEAAQYFDNFHICGDWVQTGLPCTMESAAKSVRDIII